MKKVCVIIIVLLLCSGISFFCGKKKPETKDVVVVGTDTITCEQLSELSANQEETHAKKRQLSLALTLAKKSPPVEDAARFREVVGDFKDQLSLQSGDAWTDHAARTLYCASKEIKVMLEKEKDVRVVKSYIDSIIKKMNVPPDTGSYALDYGKIFEDSAFSGTEKDFAAIISSLFGMDENLSKSIANFIYSESINTQKAAPADDMVKGLVFDSASAKKQAHSLAAKTNEPVENSALALKFRNQQSINSTMSEHIPNLEALYKKVLKLYPDMSGTIYVTFKVNYAGEVITATIKSSEIKNEQFINPLLDYITKITFKPIPDNVGNMTFDYPFEFKKYE